MSSSLEYLQSLSYIVQKKVVQHAVSVSTPCEILIGGSGAHAAHFMQLTENRLVLELHKEGIPPNLPIQVEFLLDNEKFLVKGLLESVVGKLATLEGGFEVFKIQRRNNFRINVTGPTHIFYNVINVDGNKVEVQAPVVNISLGGALLELPKVDNFWAPGKEVIGVVVSTENTQVEINSTIRRVEKKTIHGEDFYLIGVQFDEFSDKDHGASKLQNLILQCSREASRYQNF